MTLPSLYGPLHGHPYHDRILNEWHTALDERSRMSWWREILDHDVQRRIDDLTAVLSFIGRNPWIVLDGYADTD